MIRFFTNRWSHFLLLLLLLGTAIFCSFSTTRWRQEIQYLVSDQFNKEHWRPNSDQVLIIDIDDDSLSKIGQWPWPRTVLADIITSLTEMGAKVIVFDGVLAEPDRSSPDVVAQSLPNEDRFLNLRAELESLDTHDDILAKAIKESGIFVSAFSWGSHENKAVKPELKKDFQIKPSDTDVFLDSVSRFTSAATFIPSLERASAGNGSFMATPDHDGVLRRTGLVFSDGESLYPSLSLEALRVGSGDEKLSVLIAKTPTAKRNVNWDTAYRIVIGDVKIPVEENGEILMYYRPFDDDDYLSAYKVISDEHRAEAAPLVKDRYVLMGSSAEGLKDLRSTAIEPYQPGVEIHANAIEQILQQRFLLRPFEIQLVEANFIMLSGLLMIFLAPFIHVIVLGGLCALLIGGAFIGAEFVYVQHSVLLDPFYPSLCVFGIFVVSTLLTYLRTERERREVRGAFGLYISPDFMTELTNNPDKLKLGGEIRDLTVMFTDIRSFTTISEGLTPEELIQLMNDFLTPMSDLVMQNRGTIDKYMGDAMMAFWNAPLDDAEHERNACRAALGMQAALDPINQRVREKAETLGKTPVLLKAGIGINTGPCAVGNMGSRQRFAYSTLGDAVNLASRFEGQTKDYGVEILIGEPTFKAIEDFAVLEVDLIRVKGKTQSVKMYALLGDDVRGQDKDFLAWKRQHDKMLKLYRDGRFSQAKALAEECAGLYGAELGRVYEIYKERCTSLIKEPPGDGWSGVYEAQTK